MPTHTSAQQPMEQYQRSRHILEDLLAGVPCQTVAARHGLTRTAAERRAKRLAAELVRTVGVPGLRAEEAGFLGRLREHRDGLLEALQHYVPAAPSGRRSGRCLTREEVERGAMRIKGRSHRRWHDLALYYLLFATGLRPLEIARLQVGDYLLPDGCVRRQSVLRPQAALTGRDRPLHFASAPLDDALSAYLRERLQLRHGLGDPAAYRGLDPGSALFMTRDGTAYAIRTEISGARRQVCRTLLEVFRRMFHRADIPGLSTRSARLTMMALLHARGAEPEQIGLVLGIQDPRAVLECLPLRRLPLHELLEHVL